MLWGLAVSTLIMAVGTIIVAWLLGENNYGLYSIALTAPSLISLFRDWGMNFAIVRYTAKSNAENKTCDIRSIFYAGLIFELALGTMLSFAGFFLSDFLAAVVFHRPEIASLIQIASFTVLTGGLITAATATFTGIEKMHFNSTMIVLQSIAKTVSTVMLVMIGLSTYGAIWGFAIGSVVAGVFGVFLMREIYRNLPNLTLCKLEIQKYIRIMLKYGLPLSFSGIISGFLVQYFNFLMAIYVTNNALIGNYSIAQSFVVLITFFATPVTTMMLPAFSKIDLDKDPKTLTNIYQFSIKYASLIVVPVSAMIIAVAQPAIATLFQNRYSEAPLFLALLAISYLFTALGSLSVSSLMNGQGQTTYTLILTALTTVIGIPMGIILISNFGIIGLIVTSLTSGLPSIIIGILFVKSRYRMMLDWKASVKILLVSAISAALTYIAITELNFFPSLLRLIVGVIIFILTYVVAIAITRTIDRDDIKNMRDMLNALGPLGRLFNIFLNPVEKLVKSMEKNKQTA